MSGEEAMRELTRHLIQCGALMPIDWITTHGEGSRFMEAYKMAMDALRDRCSCDACADRGMPCEMAEEAGRGGEANGAG